MARTLSPHVLFQRDLFPKACLRIAEVADHIRESLSGRLTMQGFGTTGNEDDILKAVCAGLVDHVYYSERTSLFDSEGRRRKFGRGSVVDRTAPWYVAVPRNIEFRNNGNSTTVGMVEMATILKPEWLLEVAPHLIETREVDGQYTPERGVVFTEETIFNGHVLIQKEVERPDHPDTKELMEAYRIRSAAHEGVRRLRSEIFSYYRGVPDWGNNGQLRLDLYNLLVLPKPNTPEEAQAWCDNVLPRLREIKYKMDTRGIAPNLYISDNIAQATQSAAG
jgi:hypothetical protein